SAPQECHTLRVAKKHEGVAEINQRAKRAGSQFDRAAMSSHRSAPVPVVVRQYTALDDVGISQLRVDAEGSFDVPAHSIYRFRRRERSRPCQPEDLEGDLGVSEGKLRIDSHCLLEEGDSLLARVRL